MLDGSMQFHQDYLYFSDTQNWPNPNGIWLKDFDVSGSATVGTPFSFATRAYGEPVDLMTNFVTYYTVTAPDPTKAAWTWAANELQILADPMVQNGTIAGLEDGLKRVLYPNIINVATDTSGNITGTAGQTFVSTLDTSQMTPRWYSVGDISFENWNGSSYDPRQSLGSLNLDAVSQGPSLLRFWAHPASGISFDYTTVISAVAFDGLGNPIGGLHYHYNTTTAGVLSFSNINIAGSATGDPEASDFTTVPWVFSGTFKIGTIGDADVYDNGNLIFKGNQPATIDIGTDNSNNSYISQNLPMSGTIRVADVNFGGQDFGPIAIDNIQVHRLNLKISP
jgi:hypothetical protein